MGSREPWVLLARDMGALEPAGVAKEKAPNPQAPGGLPGALKGPRVLFPHAPATGPLGPPELLGTSRPGGTRWGCRGTGILEPPGGPPGPLEDPRAPAGIPRAPVGPPCMQGGWSPELRGPTEAPRRVREGPRDPSPSPFPPSLGDCRGDGGQLGPPLRVVLSPVLSL